MKNTFLFILSFLLLLASCKSATDSKFNGTWYDKKTETGTLLIEQVSSNKFNINVNGRTLEGTLIDDVLEFTADSKVSIKYDVEDQLLIDNKSHWIRPEKSKKNNYVGIWKRANFYGQPTLVKGGFLQITKDEKNQLKVEEGHIFKGEMTPNTGSKFDAVVLQDTILTGRRLIKEDPAKSVYTPKGITMKLNSRGMLELTANGETEKFQKKS